MINVLVLGILAAAYIAGWTSCVKKEKLKAWAKGLFKSAHQKVDSL